LVNIVVVKFKGSDRMFTIFVAKNLNEMKLVSWFLQKYDEKDAFLLENI
jgi:hypothetical protein